MYHWPSKDPDAVVDYQFDWTDRLDVGETILTSTFILASGDVSLGSQDITNTVTTIWLSAGTNNTVAVVTNRITTSGGRTWDASAKLRIRSA